MPLLSLITYAPLLGLVGILALRLMAKPEDPKTAEASRWIEGHPEWMASDGMPDQCFTRRKRSSSAHATSFPSRTKHAAESP